MKWVFDASRLGANHDPSPDVLGDDVERAASLSMEQIRALAALPREA